MIQLLYFSAQWCRPCKAFSPRLVDEAEARGLELLKVDIDGPNGHLVDEYGVASVPTVLVLKDGKAVDKFGPLSTTYLRARLDAAEEGIAPSE
ncbi:thioredoxin 1 [Micromonospora sp. A200]|uniref:thioredoxin family protein n=1 Tax=Micromonospora sp. A200 TaxID=2940568 RepID=UPI0024742F3D|nr:thioredoxin family protein [Micromonospora sp. A200]MDH6462045.1 thioredoxin 1 [Micromonospora sp. A200]